MARTVGKDAPINIKSPATDSRLNTTSAVKTSKQPRFTGGPGITTPAPPRPGKQSGAPRWTGGPKLTTPSPGKRAK